MTAEEFGIELEQYFGTKVNAVQRREVKRWAERRSPRALGRVFRSVVGRETFFPRIATLNVHALEVDEGYPELHAHSYNAQLKADQRALTDDAGWTEQEMEANLARLREICGGAAASRRLPKTVTTGGDGV